MVNSASQIQNRPLTTTLPAAVPATAPSTQTALQQAAAKALDPSLTPVQRAQALGDAERMAGQRLTNPTLDALRNGVSLDSLARATANDNPAGDNRVAQANRDLDLLVEVGDTATDLIRRPPSRGAQRVVGAGVMPTVRIRDDAGTQRDIPVSFVVADKTEFVDPQGRRLWKVNFAPITSKVEQIPAGELPEGAISGSISSGRVYTINLYSKTDLTPQMLTYTPVSRAMQAEVDRQSGTAPQQKQQEITFESDGRNVTVDFYSRAPYPGELGSGANDRRVTYDKTGFRIAFRRGQEQAVASELYSTGRLPEVDVKKTTNPSALQGVRGSLDAQYETTTYSRAPDDLKPFSGSVQIGGREVKVWAFPTDRVDQNGARQWQIQHQGESGRQYKSEVFSNRPIGADDFAEDASAVRKIMAATVTISGGDYQDATKSNRSVTRTYYFVDRQTGNDVALDFQTFPNNPDAMFGVGSWSAPYTFDNTGTRVDMKPGEERSVAMELYYAGRMPGTNIQTASPLTQAANNPSMLVINIRRDNELRPVGQDVPTRRDFVARLDSMGIPVFRDEIRGEDKIYLPNTAAAGRDWEVARHTSGYDGVPLPEGRSAEFNRAMDEARNGNNIMGALNTVQQGMDLLGNVPAAALRAGLFSANSRGRRRAQANNNSGPDGNQPPSNNGNNSGIRRNGTNPTDGGRGGNNPPPRRPTAAGAGDDSILPRQHRYNNFYYDTQTRNQMYTIQLQADLLAGKDVFIQRQDGNRLAELREGARHNEATFNQLNQQIRPDLWRVENQRQARSLDRTYERDYEGGSLNRLPDLPVVRLQNIRPLLSDSLYNNIRNSPEGRNASVIMHGGNNSANTIKIILPNSRETNINELREYQRRTNLYQFQEVGNGAENMGTGVILPSGTVLVLPADSRLGAPEVRVTIP